MREREREREEKRREERGRVEKMKLCNLEAQNYHQIYLMREVFENNLAKKLSPKCTHAASNQATVSDIEISLPCLLALYNEVYCASSSHPDTNCRLVFCQMDSSNMGKLTFTVDGSTRPRSKIGCYGQLKNLPNQNATGYIWNGPVLRPTNE